MKVEARDRNDETGLDMYVHAPDDSGNNPPEMEDMDEQYDTGDFNTGEIEGSNDGSNLSGDQSSWYQSSDKGRLQYMKSIMRIQWWKLLLSCKLCILFLYQIKMTSCLNILKLIKSKIGLQQQPLHLSSVTLKLCLLHNLCNVMVINELLN